MISGCIDPDLGPQLYSDVCLALPPLKVHCNITVQPHLSVNNSLGSSEGCYAGSYAHIYTSRICILLHACW